MHSFLERQRGKLNSILFFAWRNIIPQRFSQSVSLHSQHYISVCGYCKGKQNPFFLFPCDNSVTVTKKNKLPNPVKRFW